MLVFIHNEIRNNKPEPELISLVTIGESARPISLIFYADAISLLINATKTMGCTEPFEQIARTHFTSGNFWRVGRQESEFAHTLAKKENVISFGIFTGVHTPVYGWQLVSLKSFLPEVNPTGLWPVLCVCVSVCHFGTRGVWKPADLTYGYLTTY